MGETSEKIIVSYIKQLRREFVSQYAGATAARATDFHNSLFSDTLFDF